MTKGRKPKPTHLRLLTGNPSGRKLNKNEPKYSKIEVEAPEHLDNAAKAEWGRVYGEMAAQGMITVVDRAALSAYCVSYSRWVKAETKLALMMDKSDDNLFGGMIFKTHRNGLSQNPLIRIADRAMENMVRIAAEFGMTPSSRTRAGRGSSGDPFGYDPSDIGDR